MKLRALCAVLLAAFASSTVFAETDWVDRFLDRYTLKKAMEFSRRPGAPRSLWDTMQNGAIPLTTEDVVRLLLENNRDLSVSRAVPVSSAYLVSSAYGPFQPNFHVIGSINHTKTPSSNLLAGAADLIQLFHDYRIGIDQTLQTGTAYSAEFEVSRSSSNSVFNVFNPAYNGAIRYLITQHLLRDFGETVNSRVIRIARNNEKISELDFELQIIDLVTEALNSYWDLVFAAEDVQVKERSLDLAKSTLHDNEIQVQVGTMAPIDLIQAEAEVATRRDELITAQYSTDKLQDEMKKRISRDTDPGLAFARLNLIEPVRQPGSETLLSLSQAVQFALENRREMKQADYDIDNQDITIAYTKNQLRPVLDITAGYTHVGLGGTATLRTPVSEGAQIIRVIPGGIGDMFSQLFSYNFPGYSAGFTLQIPLWNRAGKADYHRAINDRDVSLMKKSAIAQRIALEVRNAYTELDMNRARVETARKARELTSRKLDAEQKKFDLGTSTVRFVLEEQRNLAQAETNEMQALVNYAKSLVAYDHAIGNTLARNNIQFDKQLPAQISSVK